MSTLTACTSDARPGSPSTGDMLFETDTKNIIIYNGTNWRAFENDGATAVGVANNLSASFDGTGDYIDCGDCGDIDSAANLTISAWLYIEGTISASDHIYLAAYTSASDRFFMQITSSTNFRFGSAAASDDIAFSTMANDTWYNVTAVVSGTTLTAYLNGVLQGSAPIIAMTANAGDNLHIGRYTPSAGYDWEGKIDEVAIWDASLDGANVKQVYNVGLPMTLTSNALDYTQSSNLKYWWRMGDHASDTIDGGGSPTNGGTIGNVENAANPGTNDGTGTNATYSSTRP